MEIGVLGATGPAGRGLAARLASLGNDVIAGSRDATRSEATVAEVASEWGGRVATLVPGSNDDAAGARDLVVIATVWDAAVDTARDHATQLDGKIVISMANGLERVGKEFHPVLPPEGSIASAIQVAAPGARVVAAFQHVPAAAFAAIDDDLHSDVIVCGDDQDARNVVLDLVESMAALRGFDGGSLANAIGIETFAALLLSVNVRYKGKGTLRLLGVENGRT